MLRAPPRAIPGVPIRARTLRGSGFLPSGSLHRYYVLLWRCRLDCTRLSANRMPGVSGRPICERGCAGERHQRMDPFLEYRGWPVAAIGGALILLTRSWEGDLHGEPLRYACVAKTMAVGGNWLHPHEQPGMPYANKSPLMFWLTAVNFSLFGTGACAVKSWPAAVGGPASAYSSACWRAAVRQRSGPSGRLYAGFTARADTEYRRFAVGLHGNAVYSACGLRSRPCGAGQTTRMVASGQPCGQYRNDEIAGKNPSASLICDPGGWSTRAPLALSEANYSRLLWHPGTVAVAWPRTTARDFGPDQERYRRAAN
jgi:hypothetical protein